MNEPSSPERPTSGDQVCDACGAVFSLHYGFQQIPTGDTWLHACSMPCRAALVAPMRPSRAPKKRCTRIAVLNQKGGTGKTTTAVNLAAGLAEAGHRVLLMDTDAQGHAALSLGVSSEATLYHVFVEGVDARTCIVNARERLDVLVANALLASVELYLARLDSGRDRVLAERMRDVDAGYDYVIIDCGPSLSLVNQNALMYADRLLIPVSCDYLSLVGVHQVMATVERVHSALGHRVRVLGVLPTFYDPRNRISDASIAQLRARYDDRVLAPIRVNTKLKEAPSQGKTIFDYAPESRGARDYRQLVAWVQGATEL